MQFSDDFAGLGIESGKQRGSSMAQIIVRAAFNLSGAHGQQRSGALQSLNLTLFIDTQHQGVLRGIEVKSHDVPHLVDK
jgi:hypothetical protein